MRVLRHAERSAVLGDLRARIRALELASDPNGGAVAETASFGAVEIDRALPWGGMPRGAVHEIVAESGERDEPAAAGFTAMLLGRFAAAGSPALWCLCGADLHAPGLGAFGLDPSRLIAVRAMTSEQLLWVVEEAVRTPALAAVVGEVATLGLVASRRLQLAARESGTACLLLYRGRHARPGLTAAATRWHVAAMPGGSPRDFDGFGSARWRVTLARCRGAAAGPAWLVEWCHETHRLVVAAPLADRSHPAHGAERIGARRRAAG